MFIDENGAKSGMTARYGWGPRNERVVAAALHGRCKTTTLLNTIVLAGTPAAMTSDEARTRS